MKKSQIGISLIVLVITIIVIIILAGVVILNINQNNTADKAKEAVFKSDVANFKADLGMYHVNELGKTMADYDSKLLDGDKSTLTYNDEALQGKTMVDAIPLMNQKLQYTEKFIIFEGKLVYVGNNPKEIEWSDDLDIPSTAKSPIAIIELPNPAEVKSGTEVSYTIRFSAGNKISNFKKENITLLTEEKQSTTNNITIGELSGTDTEKTVEVAVDTTNLEAGKYMLQVKSGTVADELTGLTNKEVYSESFVVDNTAPGIPEILVEPITPTNKNVIVTINYSEDSLTKQYKIGTGDWQDYTTEFIIEENVDIIARAINKVSTETLGEVLAIRNIDKQAPIITLATTGTTTSSITVKATASDLGTAGLDTNSYEYSKDDGVTWTTASSNTTYIFENLTTGTYKLKARVKDKATNVGVSSTLTELTKGMDTLGNITIVPSTTAPTNQNITVTINYPTGIAVKQYKLGSGSWQNYTGVLTITENTDILAKGMDVGGNVLEIADALAVRNIDKQAPTITLATTATTTSSITIKATASDVGTAGINTSSYEYSKDDGVTWTTASSNITYTFEGLATGTYKLKVRVKDKATNVGVSSTLTELTKGMETLGNITIVPSTIAPTNQNITVTINYPTGIAVKQYKLGTGSWQNYSGVLTITENTDILAKGMDAGGNVLEIADALAVRNIDKQAPTITLVTTATTTSSITVKATASDVGTAGINTSSYEYSKDDGTTWTTPSSNTTYTFEGLATGTYKLKVRVKDKATNVGTSTTLTGLTKGMETLGNITIIPSTTAPTNQNITVTINYPTGIAVKQYKMGSGSWQNYTGVLTITENTDVLAKGMDAGGNVLEIADALSVRNIDKQAPTITLTTTSTTTSSITIKATATDVGTAGINTSSYEYSKDDGVTWTTPSSNTTYTFENLTTGTYKLKARVKDKATNVGVSSTISEVTKGMETLGNITIIPSTTVPTNQNITVTINYPTGIAVKQYKIGTGSWQNYTGVLTITQNTDILAKGMDAGGNVLEIADALAIRNIDKVNPNAASISATSSNGKITGTISVSDNSGGSGIDFTNSKYVINTISTTYGTTASIWSSATTINTSPKSINETKSDGTYYVHVLVVDRAGNKVVSKSSSGIVVSNNGITDPGWDSSKGVNSPVLKTGMTPIKWNGSTWVDTTISDSSWYNYTNKQWANARTADGSMWVWIPRYEYKIPTPHSSTAQTILINFKQGTSTSVTSGYILHPGFTFGTTQLKGIWIGKFESGRNSSTKGVIIKPLITSWRSLTISNKFDVSKNMETDATYGWGTSGNGIDTHLMKNVEWGAVAYFSQSIYGKNAEIWKNPCKDYVTGQAGEIANPPDPYRNTEDYNTINGMQASTSGNITGIYDMSGGATENVAAYIDSGVSRLTENGLSLVNAEAKYKDLYVVGSQNNRAKNYSANSTKKGDAIYETSSSGEGTGSAWYGTWSYMPYSNSPFFSRGGGIYGSASNNSTGIFEFDADDGNDLKYYGFRVTLAINEGI